MIQLLIVVLFALSTAGCADRGRVSVSPPTERYDPEVVAAGIKLRLNLGVVNNPSARGLEPQKAILLGLENAIQSGESVWVNGRLAPPGEEGDGEVKIEVGDEHGSIEDGCRHNVSEALAWDYLLLQPGASITRLLTLSCFPLPSSGRIWVRASYEDRRPQQPPKEIPLTPVFRGRLVSNTAVFASRGQ